MIGLPAKVVASEVVTTIEHKVELACSRASAYFLVACFFFGVELPALFVLPLVAHVVGYLLVANMRWRARERDRREQREMLRSASTMVTAIFGIVSKVEPTEIATRRHR